MKKEGNSTENSSIRSMLPDTFNEQDFDFPIELLPVNISDAVALHDHSKMIMNLIIEYRELMMMYTCAMKEIRTKFEILNTEFNIRYQRNPINFINTRLKRSSSIAEKMVKNSIPFSIENLEANFNDIAGIRVICSYVDDIYLLSKALIKQSDVTLISEKDYIENPKPNGYRSMHLIVSIPVFFADHMKHIKVEVQIRTIAMDFWATLEHELKYKNQIANEAEIVAELKKCADTISETDSKMLEIRKKIEENTCNQTEDEILIKKMRRIDVPFE